MSYSVGANLSSNKLIGELRRQNIHMVIALGRDGMKAEARLGNEVSVVVGGVLSASERTRGTPIFSLAPDPTVLFQRLKSLMPSVKRVFVVYNPTENAWLVQLAKEAARSEGLELVEQTAADVRSAMRVYAEIFSTINQGSDAIWVPQDSISSEASLVLPFLLRESWARSVPIFSSSAGHAKRGALFSLYPDARGIGHTLADSALGGALASCQINPLKDVHAALNVRTARHLGLLPNNRQLEAFDIVVPGL